VHGTRFIKGSMREMRAACKLFARTLGLFKGSLNAPRLQASVADPVDVRPGPKTTSGISVPNPAL
jgi:hypothetical protein